ncbi:MAG: peptidylprolyl isomerase [Thiolinea sp.]
MQIVEHTVVTLDCSVTDDSGQTYTEALSGQILNYLHGARNIVPGLEQQLTGKQTGDNLTVIVPPEEAYGVRNAELVRLINRSELTELGLPDEQIQPGAAFTFPSETGNRILKILDVYQDDVMIDANHPLAGKTFTYEVNILSARPATAEEIEQGRPLEGFLNASSAEN